MYIDGVPHLILPMLLVTIYPLETETQGGLVSKLST